MFNHRLTRAVAIAVAIAVTAAPTAFADDHWRTQPAAPQDMRSPNARGTDVAAQDQQTRQPVVNARGTDVAAQDQQTRQPVINARGTDVGAADQQAPIVGKSGPVSPADRPDGSSPTPLLLALMALGLMLAGLGVASRVTATRRRTRATA